MKKLLLTLVGASCMLGSVQAEEFDTDAILSGIKDTKLIFNCDHEDAKVVFKVTDGAQATKMFMIDEEGSMIQENTLEVSAKQCPEKSQIPIGDYCVQPMCMIKEIAPAQKKPNPLLGQNDNPLDNIF
tara:strand:+ start:522 stop:905 length:384 start_codon:yes stop_codon:yes gene_type:complete